MYFSGTCVALFLMLWSSWFQLTRGREKFFNEMGYQRSARNKSELHEFLTSYSCQSLAREPELNWCQVLPPTDYAPPGSKAMGFSIVCSLLQHVTNQALARDLSC